MVESLLEIAETMERRFDQITAELDTFMDFLNVLDDQIPEIVAQKRGLIHTPSRYSNGPHVLEEILIESTTRAFQEFTEIGIPRFFYCPMLIVLYAICEAAITEIAEIIQKEEKYDLGIDDLAGGFLKRAAKYYEKVLKIKIFIKTAAWKRLKDVKVIRDAVAHANGRINYLENKTKRKVRALDRSMAEVEIADDCVIISRNYLVESTAMLSESINDLIDRVAKKYPPPKSKEIKDV